MGLLKYIQVRFSTHIFAFFSVCVCYIHVNEQNKGVDGQVRGDELKTNAQMERFAC